MTNDTQRPEGMRVVHATEIVDKIKKSEPVEYHNVIIRGDLYQYSIEEVESAPDNEFKIKTVASQIEISNSIIDGRIFFLGFFQKPVSFAKCQFNTDGRFGGSTFNEGVDFSESKFMRWVDLSGCKFCGYADFREANFNSDVDFSGSEFNGYADFRGSEFSRNAAFENTDFSVYVNFRRAEFKQDAEFIGSKFSGYPKRRYSKINEGAPAEKLPKPTSTNLSKRLGFKTKGDWNILELKEFITSIFNIYNGFLALEIQKKEIAQKHDFSFNQVYQNIERFAEDDQLLKVHRIKMGSSGGFSLIGLDKIIEQFRITWDYYSYESRKKNLMLVEDCLKLVRNFIEDFGGNPDDLIKVLCKEVKLLKDLESIGKLEAVTENFDYIPPIGIDAATLKKCCK